MSDNTKVWYVLRGMHVSLDIRDELTKIGCEVFLPTTFEMTGNGAKPHRQEKPILFNMVFVSTDDVDRVFSWVNSNPSSRIGIMFNRKPKFATSKEKMKPITISDDEMQIFRKAVQFYTNGCIPYVKPTEIDLETGDEVRIVGGDFNGVEGTFLAQKGKEGGTVIVSLSKLIGVKLNIEPQFLQVIRFGKGNKHLYKAIELFTPRLEKALLAVGGLETTPLAEHVSESVHAKRSNLDFVKVFVNRYSEVRIEQINARIKMNTLLYGSYVVLGDEECADKILDAIKDDLPKIKAQSSLDFVKRFVSDHGFTQINTD